jgi:glycogen operon protein
MSATADIRTVNTLPGSEFPLGATVTGTGTNFAVASEVADGMMLCLFD